VAPNHYYNLIVCPGPPRRSLAVSLRSLKSDGRINRENFLNPIRHINPIRTRETPPNACPRLPCPQRPREQERCGKVKGSPHERWTSMGKTSLAWEHFRHSNVVSTSAPLPTQVKHAPPDKFFGACSSVGIPQGLFHVNSLSSLFIRGSQSI